MKVFHATSLLLASSAASSEPREPRSVAGLRELRKLASSGDLLPGLGGPDCGDSCSDPDQCTSFMGALALGPSVLEGSCDAGCVPEVALSTCDRLCGDNDAATASVQRLGLFGAADLVCGNCEFYRCCAGDGASFEACRDALPDDDYFPDADSLLPDFAFGEMPDLDHLDSYVPDFDFGDTSEDIPGLDLDAFLSDIFPDTGSILPNWDFGSNDSGSASDLSILGQLGGMAGGFDCPESCGDSALCESVLMGVSGVGDETLQDACNAGCLPVVSSAFCEDTCGNVDGLGFAGSVVDVACDACRFAECCVRDGDEGDGETFDACKELLPDADNLLLDMDWDVVPIQTTEWNLTDWNASLDWDGIAADLSELIDSIHSLFDEALGDFQAADDFDFFPVTCNPETCPIDGLCDADIIHLSSIDFDDVCKTNAFFECVEGLDDMCLNECDDALGGTFLSPSFCSMCNLAECCRDNGDAKTFEDCAWGVIPGEINDAIANIADVAENITDSIADAFDQISDFASEVLPNESVDQPVEYSSTESSESRGTSAEDSEPDSLDDPIVDESADSPSEDLDAEALEGGSADTPADASASELSESPGDSSEPLDILEAEQLLEVSRARAESGPEFEPESESGSRASAASAILAVASIAALTFVSF